MGDKELQGPSSIVTYLILFTSEDWVRNSGKRGDTSRAKFTLGGRDIGNVLRIQLNIFTSYFLPPQITWLHDHWWRAYTTEQTIIF